MINPLWNYLVEHGFLVLRVLHVESKDMNGRNTRSLASVQT